MRLVLQWVGPHSDPNFQHGIFVPVFALFVVWQDRKQLAAIAPAPSWIGLPLIVPSMVALVLGVLGAEIFSQRVSLLILLAGLIILFEGWKFFRAVLFPWAFLFLMVPIPSLILSPVTFPLQLLASKLASGMLEMVGVPVLLQGNMITLARMQLDVAEPCSGIRSLLTLLTLAIIYGYLLETRMWVRVVLACSAVPIAVLANCFRIFVQGLLVHSGHESLAEGISHELWGLLVFATALVMLFALHHVISLVWKHDSGSQRSAVFPEQQSARREPLELWSARFGIVAVLLLTTAIGLQVHASGSVHHVGLLPSEIGNWKGVDKPISQQELDILGPGEYLMRDYESVNQPKQTINVYIPFFPSQKVGDTVHSPSHCLSGAGWIPLSRKVIQLKLPNGSSIPVNRYVVSRSGEQQLVLYWFQAHGRVVAREWEAKYYLIDDSIHMNRSDGGMVRLMTPMLEGETPDATQERMMNFVSPLLPLLDSYIPQ